MVNHSPGLQIFDTVAISSTVWCSSCGGSVALLLFDSIKGQLFGKGVVSGLTISFVDKEVLHVSTAHICGTLCSQVCCAQRFPAIGYHGSAYSWCRCTSLLLVDSLRNILGPGSSLDFDCGFVADCCAKVESSLDIIQRLNCGIFSSD